MAFRSELEAAQHRAEAAENDVHRLRLELTSQAARIDRVAEIEGQLEAARAKLREQGPKSQTVAVLVGGLLGMAIAGGGMYFVVQRGDAGDRATATEGDERHDRELLSANAERDDARLALSMLGEERDELEETLARSSRETRAVVLAFSAAPTAAVALSHPIDLGPVSGTRGDSPVPRGVRCDIVVPEDTACAGTIRCGGVALHSFGCRGRRTTEIGIDGHELTVSESSSDERAWSLTIDTRL